MPVNVVRTPTLVPDNDQTVHLVLNDFGKLGCAYVETDEARADEWTIVSNIAKGQYSNREGGGSQRRRELVPGRDRVRRGCSSWGGGRIR